MRKLAYAVLLAGVATLASVTAIYAQSMPNAASREVMIKSWLLTFNDANLADNYSVLRALSAKPLADKYSARELSQVFKTFRDNNIDLSGIVIYPPIEDPEPYVDAEGYLNLKGYFETEPNFVSFDLSFLGYENSNWRLIGINVELRSPEDFGVKPANAAGGETSGEAGSRNWGSTRSK